MMKTPEDCTGLVDTRKATDRVDLDIIQALGRCVDYVEAVSCFKASKTVIPVPERVATMLPERARWVGKNGPDTPLAEGLSVRTTHWYTARQIKH